MRSWGVCETGVAVLDRELRISTWNSKMEDLWGLCREDVYGKHFANLDIGLSFDEIAPSVRACIATSEEGELTMECRNRLGKAVTCRVSVIPLRNEPTEPNRGIIVTVEEVR